MTNHLSRRTFLSLMIAATGGAVLGTPLVMAVRQDDPMVIGDVRSPAWTFVVHTLQDPYAGDLVRPEQPAEGMRYVGADVEVRNGVQGPLNFRSGDIRLVDTEGFEYHIDWTVAGSEPPLPDVNMSPGGQVRGWLWYAVPEASRLVELVYNAPSPRLAVTLPEPDDMDGPATPEAAGTPEVG